MLAELATALRGVGKHAEAQRCCSAAVKARPDYQRGWLELGRCQAAQGGPCSLAHPPMPLPSCQDLAAYSGTIVLSTSAVISFLAKLSLAVLWVLMMAPTAALS